MSKLIKRIFLYTILYTSSFNVVNAIGSYVPNYLNSIYIFELIKDCIGKETLKKVVDDNPFMPLDLFYDVNGDLKKIRYELILDDGYMWSGFLDEEWERIFDYLDDLPPMPLPNPSKDSKYRDIEDFMNDVELVSEIQFDGSWFKTWKYNDEYHRKYNPNFDWLEHSHSSFDIKGSGENPDSLFGDMKWYELRAYNSGNLIPKESKSEMITPEDFRKDGYSWKKIPINMYTVNIQMPTGTTIYIAPDSLSASCIFPDSTRISIQYTKGEQTTKLWDGEKDPRKRLITNITVTDKDVFSSGVFIDNQEETFWTRIRYRYGITITMYSSPISMDLNDYVDNETIVLRTATIVLRPKYKNIYLKD